MINGLHDTTVPQTVKAHTLILKHGTPCIQNGEQTQLKTLPFPQLCWGR